MLPQSKMRPSHLGKITRSLKDRLKMSMSLRIVVMIKVRTKLRKKMVMLRSRITNQKAMRSPRLLLRKKMAMVKLLRMMMTTNLERMRRSIPLSLFFLHRHLSLLPNRPLNLPKNQ